MGWFKDWLNKWKKKEKEEDKETLLKETVELLLEKDNLITEDWVISLEPEIAELYESIKKFSNTYRTNLPKPIEFPCASVIFSTYCSKEYEAIIYDMSQYEEKKIAHIMVFSTDSLEEFCKDEDFELTQEEIENQSIHAIAPGGTVLYYEETDEWDYTWR